MNIVVVEDDININGDLLRFKYMIKDTIKETVINQILGKKIGGEGIYKNHILNYPIKIERGYKDIINNISNHNNNRNYYNSNDKKKKKKKKQEQNQKQDQKQENLKNLKNLKSLKISVARSAVAPLARAKLTECCD